MDKHLYTLWSLWPELSTLYRLFVLILTGVSIYVLFSAVVIIKNLYFVTSAYEENLDTIQSKLIQLYARCANLKQTLAATFYLFGFLFFVGLQNAPIAIGERNGIPIIEILGNFVLHFIFAANVFLVFLVLHLVQWLVSSRLNSRVHSRTHLIPISNFP
jgi:hypothetical protein